MSKMEPLRVEWLSPDQVKPDPRNPHKHSDRQVKQIAASIETFGFNSPVLIDRANKIVAGHGRVQAAKALKSRVIPVLRLEHLNDDQARAFMIADNRLSELSEWDERFLAEALTDLSKLTLDFNIEATGFTVGEIDLRIEGLNAVPNDGEDKADILSSPTTQRPVTCVGDLWCTGDHRVYCGNALEARAYEALMQGKRAAMSFSDPPYNVRLLGHATGRGCVHHREFTMASGEMSEAEFEAFLTMACTLAARNNRDGSVHYVCTDWRHIGELLNAGKVAFSDVLNLCVWSKHNPGMGSFYRSQHELVFVFKAGRGRHRNNVQLGRNGRNRSNVWSYPGMTSFGRGSDEGNLAALHPTVKPVRLVADAITGVNNADTDTSQLTTGKSS